MKKYYFIIIIIFVAISVFVFIFFENPKKNRINIFNKRHSSFFGKHLDTVKILVSQSAVQTDNDFTLCDFLTLSKNKCILQENPGVDKDLLKSKYQLAVKDQNPKTVYNLDEELFLVVSEKSYICDYKTHFCREDDIFKNIKKLKSDVNWRYFSENKNLLIGSKIESGKEEIYVYNYISNRLFKISKNQTLGLASFSLSHDFEKIAVIDNDELKIYSLNDQSPESVIKLPKEEITKTDTKSASINYLVWNYQKNKIAFSTHNLIYLIDLEQNQNQVKLIYVNPFVYQVPTYNQRLIRLSFSKNGKYLFFVKNPIDNNEVEQSLFRIDLQKLQFEQLFSSEEIILL